MYNCRTHLTTVMPLNTELSWVVHIFKENLLIFYFLDFGPFCERHFYLECSRNLLLISSLCIMVSIEIIWTGSRMYYDFLGQYSLNSVQPTSEVRINRRSELLHIKLANVILPCASLTRSTQMLQWTGFVCIYIEKFILAKRITWVSPNRFFYHLSVKTV